MSTLEREARVAELRLLRDRLGRFTVSAVQQHIEDRLSALNHRHYKHWVVYNGERVPLKDACLAAGKNYKTVLRRINKLSSPQKAFDAELGAGGRPAWKVALPLKTDRVA